MNNCEIELLDKKNNKLVKKIKKQIVKIRKVVGEDPKQNRINKSSYIIFGPGKKGTLSIILNQCNNPKLPRVAHLMFLDADCEDMIVAPFFSLKNTVKALTKVRKALKELKRSGKLSDKKNLAVTNDVLLSFAAEVNGKRILKDSVKIINHVPTNSTKEELAI